MEIENLKAFLANKGISFKTFSNMLDIDQAYLSRIAHGHQIPGKRLQKQIEELTGGVINFRNIHLKKNVENNIKN